MFDMLLLFAEKIEKMDIVLIFFSYVDKKARIRFDGMRGMYDCLTAMSTRRLKNDESDYVAG